MNVVNACWRCLCCTLLFVTVKKCMFLLRLCIFYAIVFYTVLHFTNKIVKKIFDAFHQFLPFCVAYVYGYILLTTYNDIQPLTFYFSAEVNYFSTFFWQIFFIRCKSCYVFLQ